MAKNRPNVARDLKRRLRREAGEKCANPGCSAGRTELHHIREWAVYQSHDEQHMIAICPTCHDAVHHGALEITDETLYRWKGIRREVATRGHLYIEPRKNPTVELGTNVLVGPPDGFLAFDLSPRNRWKVRIQDKEILLLSFSLSNLSGDEILCFHDNYWNQENGDLVTFKQVPGHLRVTTRAMSAFLPDWVRDGVRSVYPAYAFGEELLLADIEVSEPGVARVQGLWVGEHTAVVATEDSLYFTGHSKTGVPIPAATIGNCMVENRGSVSPTLFKIWFPDRDPSRFAVSLG